MRMKLFFVLLLAYAHVSTLSFLLHNRTKRQTRRSCPSCQSSPLCAPKYEVFPGHTACLKRSPVAVPIEYTEAEKAEMLAYHNKLRASVKPPAGDMLLMRWDPEVEMNARRWSEACAKKDNTFYHDGLRFVPGRFSLGQNFAWGFGNMKGAIDFWFNENVYYDSTFGKETSGLQDENGKAYGHYTQLVWAATSLLGCAGTKCDNTNFFVCEYARGGNVMPFKSPYTKANTPGELCPDHKTSDGLCDCGDMICENFSKINVTNCSCKCNAINPVLEQPYCQINCKVKPASFCGEHASYKQDRCDSPNVNSFCPHMCGICPCAEKSYNSTMCSARIQSIASRVERLFAWMSAVFVLSLTL